MSSDNTARDGFFTHHGIWAPGVRLFRNLQFKAKAAIVSAAFVVPIAVLAVGYFDASGSTIDFAAKERLGVEYARSAAALLYAARQPAGSTADLDAALSRLDATEQRLGTTLGTVDAFGKLRQAFGAVRGADAAARAGAIDAEQDALLDAWGAATDGSNLTLDPDMDSYYVMDAATGQEPQIVELIARLQAIGAAVLARGQASPSQARLIDQDITLLAFRADTLAVDLAKAIGATAPLAPQLAAEPATKALRQFIELARTDFMAEGGLHGEPGAWLAAAAAATTGIEALSTRSLDALDRLLAARIDHAASGRQQIAAMIVVAGLLAAYLFNAFFLVTQGGLREVQSHLEAMTAGDLTSSPRPWGRDEAAALMRKLAEMQTSLRTIVARTRASADMLVDASGEIASASLDLSARTDKAASYIGQGMAGMETMATDVRRTAGSVREVAAMASENARAADAGGAVIGQVVGTMQDIHTSSSRIGDIIGTIDGLAFQTNILALNAAVEAARAGDHGRGFAVVAGEVRLLAQRSAQAAREIKALISGSIEKVETGARIVEGAGEAMRKMVTNAGRIDTLLTEVSAASAAQSDSVTRTGTSVRDLDAMTQQNSALVEQTAAAAGNLKDQAVQLRNDVARFRLPD